MTKEALAYLAGLVDGEGTITAYYDSKSHSYKCDFQIYNTNLELMVWLKRRFGGDFYPLNRKKQGNHKQCYSWKPSRENISPLLRLMLPNLVVKKTQAKLLLEFRKTLRKKNYGAHFELHKGTTKKRKRIMATLQQLNKRGTK